MQRFNCTECKKPVVDTRRHVPNLFCGDCEKIVEEKVKNHMDKIKQQSQMRLTDYCNKNGIELQPQFKNLEIA